MSKKDRFLAYTSMCQPILEYGAPVWDPYKRSQVHNIEMIQNRAVRFVCGIRGRDESLTAARKTMQIQTLEERRRNARIRLLLHMMEGSNPALSDFIEYETNNIQPHNHSARSRSNHLLTSLPSNTNTYFHSFLPRK